MMPDLFKAFEFNPGHTPGVYYALSYIISAVLFAYLSGKRTIRLRSVLITVGFFLVLTGLMVLTDGVDGWVFVLTILIIFMIVILYFLIVNDAPWTKAIYFASRSFIVAEFTASLQWQIYTYHVENGGLPMNPFTAILFLVLIYGLIFALTYFVERRYRDINIEYQPQGRTVVILLLVGASVFTLSNLSFITSDTPFSGSNNMEIFAIRTLSDLSGVGIMLAFHIQMCENLARREKDNLSALLKMQEESYRISAESIEVVNRKYHDLKHQLALLKADIPYEEKMKFFEEMEHEISAYEARNKTGNKTLDILLSAKTLYCQSAGITLTCVADGKELDFMSAPDISVLFGNALDNAIESVTKISDPDKRLIHLTVACQKSFLHIRVENCCEDELTFRDGLPVTTKKDSLYHGFGVKSMRSIAEKYGGTMTTTLNDGWFELRILMPIPKKPTEA